VEGFALHESAGAERSDADRQDERADDMSRSVAAGAGQAAIATRAANSAGGSSGLATAASSLACLPGVHADHSRAMPAGIQVRLREIDTDRSSRRRPVGT
jgi:hypothetical protein